MTAYILRRLFATMPVMAVVAVFVFFLLRFAPGDPAAIIAGEDATAEPIAAVRAKLGLDRPMVEQFVVWLVGMLQGDFGISIFSNLPVTRLIAQRLEPTLALTLSTLFVAVVARHSARRARRLEGAQAGRPPGHGLRRAGLRHAGVPARLRADLLLRRASSAGCRCRATRRSREGLWPLAESLILPSLALGITYMALIARITRASMLEVLAQDYIRTANAKGLATDRVLLLHALKNASVPIVTVIGIGIALLISGVVITETVFNIPGLGRLTVDAVLKRDYPIVQGLILVFAGAKVLVNLLIDISYAFLDPRIRY